MNSTTRHELNEIALDQSQRYDGLANVATGNHVHFVWSWVPALVMVAIQLFVNSVDYSTKIFAPYWKLAIGTTARNSLFVNFIDQLAIAALRSSVKTRHFAVFFTTTALVLSIER
jgi:hypothetical protein